MRNPFLRKPKPDFATQMRESVSRGIRLGTTVSGVGYLEVSDIKLRGGIFGTTTSAAPPASGYLPKPGDVVDVRDDHFMESATIAAVSTDLDGSTWVDFTDGRGCSLRSYSLVPVTPSAVQQ